MRKKKLIEERPLTARLDAGFEVRVDSTTLVAGVVTVQGGGTPISDGNYRTNRVGHEPDPNDDPADY